jgi:hypothetical protein
MLGCYRETTPSLRASLLIFILTGNTLIYASAAAVGRVCLGTPAAQSSRNMTLLIPAFLGIYFHILAKPRGPQASIFLGHNIPDSCFQRDSAYHKGLEGFSGKKRDWKQCYLAHEDIQFYDQATGFRIYPSPEDYD